MANSGSVSAGVLCAWQVCGKAGLLHEDEQQEKASSQRQLRLLYSSEIQQARKGGGMLAVPLAELGAAMRGAVPG